MQAAGIWLRITQFARRILSGGRRRSKGCAWLESAGCTTVEMLLNWLYGHCLEDSLDSLKLLAGLCHKMDMGCKQSAAVCR